MEVESALGSNKLNDWIQAVGILALVASLLFVGYQIKQTRDIAISQAFQARAESSAITLVEMAANDRIIAAFAKHATGNAGDITAEELASLGMALSGGMFLWENSYYQSRLGYVGADHWTRTRASLKNALTGGPIMPIVKQNAPFMRPEFREELEAIIAEVEKEQGAQ